jgi:hypothetical protein
MACALAILAMVAVQAKNTTVTGTWTLTIESLPMRFVLAQKGSNVTGTLDYPHGAPFQLTGSFKKGTLTFSGGSESARENFTVRIDASGVLKDDDTLDGTLDAHFIEFNDAHQVVRTRDQQMKWTAVRTSRK